MRFVRGLCTLALAGVLQLCLFVNANADEERIPSDTLWRFQQRYLPWHSLPQAWNTFTGSSGIRVAVLDGFFASANADFDQNRFYRTSLAIGMLHGTQVASILGAKSDNTLLMTGVDWHCSLGLYSVDLQDDSSMAEAIGAALSHGARVINCSWRSQTGTFPEPIQRRVADAYQAGAVVIAAVGNKGADADPVPVTPGSLDGLAIGVGGLDKYGRLHPESNWDWGTDFVACADTIGVAGCPA
ncbi:MAG: S8/S53 family peptidase [Candidatus Zixiibacteriota bacterium]